MIAAPFLGEFGWEVSLWTPWLRWFMATHYPHRELTVICKPGHEGLYKDFATKVVPHEVKDITAVDCQVVWTKAGRADHDFYLRLATTALRQKRITKADFISPLAMQYIWAGKHPPHLGARGTYHKYGDGDSSRFKNRIAIHARACKNKQPERNWDNENWVKLFDTLGSVGRHFAFVGSKEDSWCPSIKEVPQCEDMRGVPLEELTNIISSCGQIIGPSSGPLALAMLCKTPVVWWSPNPKDAPRFASLWNPFKVETSCAAPRWCPDVGEVHRACARFL